MNPSQKPGRTTGYRIPIAICSIAAVLIVLVLVLGKGSDDPVVQNIVPPIPTAQTGASGAVGETVIDHTGEEVPATSTAIDGKGVAPVPSPTSTGTQPVDHGDEAVDVPDDQATDIGPFVATAKHYAELSLNRSTDAAASMGLNKKLVELSAGSLAKDLEDGTGGVQTAQVASVAKILKAIPLVNDGGYAEVLIVARQSVIDGETGETLDPKYLNYVVRLDRIPSRGYAVTSWEPQL